MYVCGTNAGVTSLWRITVTAGISKRSFAGPALAADNSACSPVTEFNNGATDRIFLSVINSGVTGGVINCGANSGCAMSFNVTGGVVPSRNHYGDTLPNPAAQAEYIATRWLIGKRWRFAGLLRTAEQPGVHHVGRYRRFARSRHRNRD